MSQVFFGTFANSEAVVLICICQIHSIGFLIVRDSPSWYAVTNGIPSVIMRVPILAHDAENISSWNVDSVWSSFPSANKYTITFPSTIFPSPVTNVSGAIVYAILPLPAPAMNVQPI